MQRHTPIQLGGLNIPRLVIMGFALVAMSSLVAAKSGAAFFGDGFTGEWDTRSYGGYTSKVRLTQIGGRVSGTYQQAGGGVSGTIDGTVSNNVLRYRWIQSNGSKGTGRFTLSEDGTAFSGFFGYDEDPDKADRYWNGKRTGKIAGEPADSRQAGGPPGAAGFTGDWDAVDSGIHRVMRLKQNGTRVTGTYEGAGVRGTVDGTVAGGILHFRWAQGNGNKGSGRFTLSADGTSFTGAWTYGDDPAKADRSWDGRRIATPPKPESKQASSPSAVAVPSSAAPPLIYYGRRMARGQNPLGGGIPPFKSARTAPAASSEPRPSEPSGGAQTGGEPVESWIENSGPFGNMWVILSPVGGGKYRYEQLGGARATGTAQLNGTLFRIDWSTASGEAGYEDFVHLNGLMSTQGTGHFTKGSRAGTSYTTMMYPDPYVGSYVDENRMAGTSTFSLTALGGGRYTFRGTGSFHASGRAILYRDKLRIDWTDPVGAAGYIEYEIVAGRLTGQGTWVLQKGQPGTYKSILRKRDTAEPSASGGRNP